MVNCFVFFEDVNLCDIILLKLKVLFNIIELLKLFDMCKVKNLFLFVFKILLRFDKLVVVSEIIKI